MGGIIKDMCEKNEVTFEQEVLAQHAFLLNSARKLLRSSLDAEDLVQETIIRAIRFQEKFDGKHLRSWLYTILRNLCINKWKKDARDRLNLAKLKGSDLYTDVTSSTEESIQTECVKTHIAQAIMQLPEAYQDAATLIFLYDQSYQETANKLNIPMGTVMSKIHRARKLLKPLLKDLRTEYGMILSGEDE